MSWRAETEMQIQIMTHGEAFCPSTMTKEILSKNQKQMTGMQKGPTEEYEIREGQEKVEEELGNEKKESTFSSPWKFCRNLLKEERGQMDENKIKEGQEEEQEEQGNKRVMYRRRPYFRSVVFTPWTHGEAFCPSTMTKETPFGNRKLLLEEITNDERNEVEEGQMEEIEIKEWHEDVEEEQDNECHVDLFSWNIQREVKPFSEGLHPKNNAKMKAFRKEIRQLKLEFAVSAQKVYTDMIDRMQTGEFKKKERLKERVIHIDLYEEDRSLFYSDLALSFRLVLSPFLALSPSLSKHMHTRYDYLWKHALGKDMNIMRILKRGSLRFVKQQIQVLDKLIRCKVCLDSDACMVFFPCRHMATCEYCGSFLDQCPVCRTFIEKTEKVNKK